VYGSVDSCNCDYIFDTENNYQKRVKNGSTKCSYCQVGPNKYHHLGCETELCPICKNPLNSNDCEHVWDWASSKNSESVESSYYLPIGRVVLFNIATFGLFSVYWMYKNWKYQIAKNKKEINPILVTLLFPIYIFPLFQMIKKDALEKLHYQFYPNLSAFIYLLASFSWLLDKSLIYLLPLNFVALIPAQNAINEYLIRSCPGVEKQKPLPAILKITLFIILFTYMGVIIYVVSQGMGSASVPVSL